jgi:rhamnose transport system permease protein
VNHLRAFPYWHETVLVALIAALFTWAAVVDPKFISVAAQLGQLGDVWELALCALPMTLIIITGGIDLSVGSTMALSGVALGMLYERGANPYVGAAAALAVGAGCGALNGWFVTVVRVHPLIVTLATLAAYRGAAEGISLARPISGFPDSFAALGTGSLAGFPIPSLVFLVLALAGGVMLARTPLGLSLYVIGHNETAARFSGIRVDRIKRWLYTCSGLIAGLAAAIYVARRNTAKADIGSGLELDVITAVVLGGTSIFGGSGRIAGTVLGVALIHETRTFVSWHYDKDELNAIVVGGLLIVAVLANRFFTPAGRR